MNLEYVNTKKMNCLIIPGNMTTQILFLSNTNVVLLSILSIDTHLVLKMKEIHMNTKNYVV